MADQKKNGVELTRVETRPNGGTRTVTLYENGGRQIEIELPTAYMVTRTLPDDGLTLPPEEVSPGIKCQATRVGQTYEMSDLKYITLKPKGQTGDLKSSLTYGGGSVAVHAQGDFTHSSLKPVDPNQGIISKGWDWLWNTNAPSTVKSVGNAMKQSGLTCRNQAGQEVTPIIDVHQLNFMLDSLFIQPKASRGIN